MHTERHDEALIFFYFHYSCQFRNRNISDASKLLTDVAFGADAHTLQETRKVEEIQEEQGRGRMKENERVEAVKWLF